MELLLLFVHKEAHYIPGRSPLQGWLKSYMVPKILAMPVSQEFLNCSPAVEESCKKPSSVRSTKMEVTTDACVPATETATDASSLSAMESSSV